MNFSETLRCCCNHVIWSPDGKYCAVAITARLEIRCASSLQLHITFNTCDVIQVVEWSADSSLILTGNYKRGILEIWNLNELEWRCKIDEGSAGVVKAFWAPDSRHIVSVADFYLRLTIWSLVNKSVCYIKYPKDASPGMQFSPDRDYFAVAERRDCKDFISLYETKSWTLVKNFEVGTRDLGGLRWSTDGSCLAVWESPIEYRVLVYAPSGQCLSSYSAYQWALGVRNCTWSPSGQFLVIGSYDQKVRLMNHITWKILEEFEHSSIIEEQDCLVYKEVEKQISGYHATLASVQGLSVVSQITYEEETSRPVTLAQISTEPTKQGNPKFGITQMLFSNNGRYLATRNENMPATVWIWNVSKLCLSSIIVHNNPVKDMSWSPQQCQLAICAGNQNIYFWTPFGCISVPVPASPSFQINSLRWHPLGSQIVLLGKDQFCVCYIGNTEDITEYSNAIT